MIRPRLAVVYGNGGGEVEFRGREYWRGRDDQGEHRCDQGQAEHHEPLFLVIPFPEANASDVPDFLQSALDSRGVASVRSIATLPTPCAPSREIRLAFSISVRIAMHARCISGVAAGSHRNAYAPPLVPLHPNRAPYN